MIEKKSKIKDGCYFVIDKNRKTWYIVKGDKNVRKNKLARGCKKIVNR